MSFRHKGWLAATVIATMICIACGQIYRPVVIPISNTPPSPGDFHTVFSLNTNAFYGLVPDLTIPNQLDPTLVYGPGSGMQIDVGGDTDLGVASLVNGTVSGANPTHGVSLPNFSRVYVASAGSVVANGVDAIASFIPSSSSTGSSGIGTVNVVSLPNFVPNPNSTLPFFCPYLPDFVAASQNSTVYVANYGAEGLASACNPNGTNSTDSIAVLSVSNNAVSNIVYLPAGSHPVAMAQVQTPNGNKLYVANQGSSTVSSFNTVDMSPNTVTGFTGTSPVWVAARGDGQKVYVLSQGDGQLWTINSATDTVTSNVSVGAGANYVLYDPNLNRLYVTNPNNSTTYIFSVAGNTPSLLNTFPKTIGSSGNYPACSNPCPMSVAALPDGTRAYIASYELVGGVGCTDPTPAPLTSAPTCFVTASVTVIDALTTTVTSTISAFPSGTAPVPEVANCLPADATGLYNPGLVPIPNALPGPVSRFAARFRVSAVAAADSSRVYVSVCDAGSVAIVNATDNNPNNPGSNIPADTLVLDLATPFGVGTASNALPQQNPIFLFPGR
jgi:YVTN family beta-propeller protein